MVPPTRPNVTRLADDKVMVRWSVPPHESLPILFFKVQYRLLGETPKPTKRSQWMTSNDDIPPNVYMYEVEGLKPKSFYRFRIAAVYSNNDNQLSNVSKNFRLFAREELDNIQLPAPNLTSVEPISETSIMLHWTLPEHNQIDFDGFYAYFRPASTAGEYSKATVDGMEKRSFQIDNLEPGTAYEFKLQSYTSSSASDFMAIITGKTLSKSILQIIIAKRSIIVACEMCINLFKCFAEPSTPAPIDPSVISPSKNSRPASKPYIILVLGVIGTGIILLLTSAFLCFLIKRRKKSGLHGLYQNQRL